MTPLPNRFPILRAVATGALALLVAMMALVHLASSESVAASCATGRAVEDAANNLGLVSDCDALLVARDTLAGSATLNWSVDSSIADWEGVILAGSPLRVTKLTLGSTLGRRGLAGEIPPELGSLANLVSLNLFHNDLGGGIPAELASLSNLQSLDLSYNGLTGEIPPELGSLANLVSLNLSHNQLSGGIPAELRSLTNLHHVGLAHNQLSGCIPEELRDVASNDLEDLDLPFCDVLLSGLNIDPGTLTPPFDSYHTDYTTVVGQSRVTVTPTNDHNASFQFLDEYNGEIADADGSLVGHQIDLGAGVTTVRIRVISPDSRATHTYTIVDRTEEIPLCTPIQGSSVDPCEPDVAQVSSNNALVDVGPEPWSVRSFLDGGRGSLFEGHLVVRGTYIPGTVRCIADNTARYPSYLGVPNNSVPEGVSQFKCYADVRVNAYVVGSGPSTLTVLVRAFGYWSNATPEAIERLRSLL